MHRMVNAHFYFARVLLEKFNFGALSWAHADFWILAG
jgi:hypothetical protein